MLNLIDIKIYMIPFKNFLLVMIILFITELSFAQNTVRGEVFDQITNEPLIGASVIIQGTTTGTVTDWDGSFTFDTDQNFPIQLEISYIGYDTKVETYTEDKMIKYKLEESSVNIETVEVTGSRISEKQTQSPLTFETMDNIAIKETPAISFYDGLGTLKEVDLTSASIGFKIINTRGFNSTSPVRSLQIIDGVDNQSPGLNFSLGNFVGASELDVNKVDLIIGASSAFYGPNAFNGVISIETKNPFIHKGLSVMTKAGEQDLKEAAIRWADAVKNKDGHEWFAYKFNAYILRATDWEAGNLDAVFDSESPITNPGGYDAVNIYGDEFQTAFDQSQSSANPGLGVYHRRGYLERDLVNYNAENNKLAAAFHFRLNPKKGIESPELILGSNYGSGTTIFQGDNRFSLRNIQFYQHKVELKQADKFFLRAYVTHEDAGDTYDPFFTAIKLQELSQDNGEFSTAYINFWRLNAIPAFEATEGYPSIIDFPGDPDGFRAALANFLTTNSALVTELHSQAQTAANAGNPVSGTNPFLEPGTPEFDAAFDDITSRISFEEGGTRFFDRSALAHINGEYKFNNIYQGDQITNVDWLVGGAFRQYLPNSQGSILLDTMGRNIDVSEYGFYTGGTVKLWNKLNVNTSLRLDKHQNFDFLLSPAASLVYTYDANTVIRGSFSSAIRNPTLADQYLFYNVGRAILLGNSDNETTDLITIESLGDFLNASNPDISLLDTFTVNRIQPEKVKTFELGFRTTLKQKLYVDLAYYYSFYDDFIGFNLGLGDVNIIQSPGAPPLLTNVQAFRISANATDRVTTQGFSIGMNYYLERGFVLNGNYSYNNLNTESDDPIIPAFNTPKHKYNLGFSGRDLTLNLGNTSIRNVGFNVTYKWVQGFLFEGSPQFTGFIDSYGLVDAQVNYNWKSKNITFKAGASNILDNDHFETYGGPLIGRLAYVSVLYDWKKKIN
jgi:outer membrane receptor protein involved in Fe transport